MFQLVIFAAGALLMMAFVSYGSVPDRSSAKLSVLTAGPGRRGLYTTSSGGE